MSSKKHIKLVVSDCHLGTGAKLADGGINPLEDFRKDDKFVEFLDYYSTGEFAKAGVELIINGDFFDMLQAKTSSSDTPYEIIENIAVYKIRRILRGHPRVIDAMKAFLERGLKIKMIWGNHDAGLWWPSVQEEIRLAVGTKIEFLFSPYRFDGVHVEHGHQYEISHHFDVDNMFLKVKDRMILNYPFGSFFVGGFLTKVKLRRHYISQVVPFNKFLRWSLIFDFWFTVRQSLKLVWFFIMMRFIYHPYRFTRVTKTIKILFEIFSRPKFAKIAPGILKANNAQILLMGHNHEATHRHYNDGTQYVNTGTWTDITSFDPGSLGRRSMPTYAIIEYPPGVEPGQGVLPKVSLQVWRGLHQVWDVFEP